MRQPDPALRNDNDFERLFVVGALVGGIVDESGIREAFFAWGARPGTRLSDLLIELGHVPEAHRAALENLIEERSSTSDRGTVVRELLRGKLPAALERILDPDLRGLLDPDGQPTLATHSLLRLLRVQGEGGLGKVWLARDAVLGRDVAVKELRPKSGNPRQARWRFVREARVLARLEHPGIVPVYALAIGDPTRADFYSMRFIGGQTLEDEITEFHAHGGVGKASPLELTRLLDVLVQVASAVAYAHSKGIVHRDLKPANVMLGEYGEVIVVDWGLAKVLDEPNEPDGSHDAEPSEDQRAPEVGAATIAGEVLGSPLYMAPEQAKGDPESVGPRTDLFGLGAILFQVLTGEAPHRRSAEVADLASLLAAVARSGPCRPRAHSSRVPRALDAVCAKATANVPADRYGSAMEFGNDLQRWMAGASVSAFPESAPRRIARWSGRHRGLAATVALLAATGIAVAIALWQDLQVRGAMERGELQGRMAMLRRELGVGINDLVKGVEMLTVADISDAHFEQMGTAALRNFPAMSQVALYSIDDHGRAFTRLVISEPDPSARDPSVSPEKKPIPARRQAMVRRAFASKNDKPFLVNLGFDQSNRPSDYVLRALLPIRRQGEATGVMALDVDLSALFEHQFQGVGAMMASKADALFICDSQWRIIYRTNPSATEADHRETVGFGPAGRIDDLFPVLRRLPEPGTELRIHREGSRVFCVEELPLPADQGDRSIRVVVVVTIPQAPLRQAQLVATLLVAVAALTLVFLLVALRRRDQGPAAN